MITPSAAYQAIHDLNHRTPIYRMTLRSGRLRPAAYWSMDEASGTRVDSVGDLDLTDNNTVTSVAGKIGLAAQFTAANSEFFDVADLNGILEIGNIDFTIAVWVKLDSKGSDRVIAGAGMETAGNWSWTLRYCLAVDRFRLTIADAAGSTTTVDSTGAPSLATWYFVVAWRDTAVTVGAGDIGIQVDTGSISVAGSWLVPAREGLFRVGRTELSGGPANFWDGAIDELGFWRTVLTQAEKVVLYNGGAGMSYAAWEALHTYEVSTSWPSSREDLGPEILEPLNLSRKALIEQNSAPLATLDFILNDLDNQATDILAAGVVGYACELDAGFFDLASSANFIRLFTGVLTEFEYLVGRYRCTARSPLVAALDKIIFSGASTTLTSAVNTSATTFPVVSTDGFKARVGEVGRILVDGEICTFAGDSGTAFTTVTRAGYVVPPATVGGIAHAAGAVVKELIALGSLTVANEGAAIDDLHPIEHLKTIIRNTGKVGIGEAGIELDNDQLVDYALDAVKVDLGVDLQFLYLFDEGLSAKSLIESICRDIAAYPYADARGRFGVKLYQVRGDAVIEDTITDAHITRWPEWTRNAERQLNTVIYHYDYNPANTSTNKYETTFRYVDEDLLKEHGREITLEIWSKGIRSEYVNGANNWCSATAAFLIDAATRHVGRFGTKANVITVKSILNRNLLETGDDVECTFSQVINLTDGTRSVTDEPFEISGMTVDFERNLLEMELLGYPD